MLVLVVGSGRGHPLVVDAVRRAVALLGLCQMAGRPRLLGKPSQGARANALVLRACDHWGLRAAVNMLVVLTAPLFWDNLRDVISGVTLVGMMYLRCCRYLGPGDFARERRVSMSGAFESTQA